MTKDHNLFGDIMFKPVMDVFAISYLASVYLNQGRALLTSICWSTIENTRSLDQGPETLGSEVQSPTLALAKSRLLWLLLAQDKRAWQHSKLQIRWTHHITRLLLMITSTKLASIYENYYACATMYHTASLFSHSTLPRSFKLHSHFRFRFNPFLYAPYELEMTSMGIGET